MCCVLLFMQPAFAKSKDTIDLRGESTLVFNEYINFISVDVFMAALIGKRASLDPSETLYVLIGSEGGEYGAALVLKDILAQIPNTAVICKYCASAAGMLFATFPGERYAVKNSQILMHEMYEDHFTAKMAQDMDKLADLVFESENFDSLMYTVLKMSKEDYEKKS